MREKRNSCMFWWEKLRKGDHLKGYGVDERIILKWILKEG
jgi:hypothetical protein